MIGALRFCACSRDSRTRMPAPSPTTNPSRPESQGRLACAGSSLRVESAFMAANPPTPIGVMVASAPPQNHHFRGAALDNFERVANRMRGSGASRGGGGFRPARAIPNGNLPRRKIDDGGRNKEGGNFPRATLNELPVLALNDVKSPDAGGNVNAYFVEIRIFPFPVRGLHRKVRARQRDLDEPRHFFEFFFLDPLKGVEVFHFAGDLADEAGGVEMRNRRNAAASGDEVSPAFLRADAQRAD